MWLMLHRCLVLVAVLFASTVRSYQNASSGSSFYASRDDDCGLYLAPSTIPNAGLGIFTTKPLQAGDTIGYGDVAIPIFKKFNKKVFNPFVHYVWEPWDVSMGQEAANLSRVTGFCPGLDAAVNSHTALINAEHDAPIYDVANLHRNVHPGAGSITPYHNGTTLASQYIPAGGELFKRYGDGWFIARTKKLGLLPLEDDYSMAQNVMSTFAKFDLSSKGQDGLWNLVSGLPWVSRTSIALPTSTQDVLQAAEQGIRSLHQPHAIRSIDFLQEHGRCLDNIKHGVSTIDGAGRGAFASRPLSEGTIITGSPLIRVPWRDFLEMRDMENDDEIIGEQVLLNYCFGHGDSTLLLCPYGNGVGYINHNATRANVEIQWAPDGVINHQDDEFEKEVWEMHGDFSVTLAFEFVAIRDIMQGEELFLDYGEEWEEAWNEHVEKWEPPEGSETYYSAADFNEKIKNETLRTALEQELEPYPSNLILRCHSEIQNHWDKPVETWYQGEAGIDCKILYRAPLDGVMHYEVELANVTKDGKPKRLYNVAQGAFRFVDKPGTTDHHLVGAFRHEMMIPDEIFPDEWRNLWDEY